MKTFKEIEKFLEDVDYSGMMSANDCYWCVLDRDVYWVWDNELYSSYITEATKEVSDYFIANLDNQTGYWITSVFPMGKKMTYEEFEGKYEDYM